MVTRVQITMPTDIKEDIDKRIKQLQITRSKFFVVAAYQYLAELKKKQLRKELRKSYGEIRQEAADIADEVFEMQTDIVTEL